MAHLESAPFGPQSEWGLKCPHGPVKTAGTCSDTRPFSHSNTTNIHKQNHTPSQAQTHRQADHIQTYKLTLKHTPSTPSDSDIPILTNACINKKPHATVTCSHKHTVTQTHRTYLRILTNTLTRPVRPTVTLKVPWTHPRFCVSTGVR